jgi:hypothetical protein
MSSGNGLVPLVPENKTIPLYSEHTYYQRTKQLDDLQAQIDRARTDAEAGRANYGIIADRLRQKIEEGEHARYVPFSIQTIMI